MDSDIALQVYLHDVECAGPLLTKAQEQQLARTLRAARAREGGAQAGCVVASIAADQAREQLIKRNLRLVISVARRYLFSGMPMADLIQAGNIGLMKAVEKFNPDLGYKFSTYATWWIRQAITREIMDNGRMIRTPVHFHEELQRFNRTMDLLARDLQRAPTWAEQAAAFGVDAAHLQLLLTATATPVSLDRLIGEDEESSLADFQADPNAPDPAGEWVGQECREAVARALGALTSREAQIVRWRHGLDGGASMTLREVGQRLAITRERVRQIETDALRKLRQNSTLGSWVDQ